MQNKLSIIKNMVWAICIVLCLIALLVCFIVGAAGKYEGEQQDGVLYLDGRPAEKDSGGKKETAQAEEQDSMQGNGSLNQLPEGADAGLSYVDSLTFLSDSSFIGLRDYGMLTGGASTNQFWGSEAGNIPASAISQCNIIYPGDGSLMPAAQAAGLDKPSTLVIALGMDGLKDVTADGFIASYETLINDIHAQSPDTVIICCAPSSIVAGYEGADNLDLESIVQLKEWIMQVCTDTGVYYADISRVLCDSTGSLGSNYASANGKTLNSTGLNLVLEFLRTHTP